ncbi:MAG TPA: sortase, partial [Anaerolineales bacterium]|nr:sortase [Anaerolineales bacterium]
GSPTAGSGHLTNNVTASSNEALDAIDSLSIPITQNPAHTTVKTQTSTGPYSVGNTITYNIAVRNTGNVTLTGVTVTDNSATVGVCVPSQPASLAPNGTLTCQASHLVTQADLDNGSYVNTATGDSDQTPAGTSAVTVNFTQNPVLTIVKSSDATGTNAVGDTITYTYDVQNTGNVILTNVTVTDVHSGLSAIICKPVQGSTLLPGATMSCTAIYTVTQADVDAGQIDNTGLVTGTPPTGSSVVDDDLLSEPISQNPALTVAKSQTSNGPYVAGDTITYSIVVRNTGNVTLTSVSVMDSNASLGACIPLQASSLQPNATMTCSASHMVTQVDLNNGSYTNTATGDSNETPPGNSIVTVNFTQNPAVNIAKTPATQTVVSGGTANFTLTVTNTGNVTLTDVTVTDVQCTSGPTLIGGDTNNDNQLQRTENWTYSCSINNVTGNFTNVANVSTMEGAADSDTAGVNVTLLQADLELDKSVNNATPSVAGNITFTLDVINKGPAPATGVRVTDVIPSGFTYVSDSSSGAYDSSTGVWNVGGLAINETKSLLITVTVNVSGSYENYAEITASSLTDPDSVPNNGSTDEDDDARVTVTPAQGDPSGLSKAVIDSNEGTTTSPEVAIGEIVTYQVSITVPPGVFANAQLVDTMERGLSYMDCVGIANNGLETSRPDGFSAICSEPVVDNASAGTPVDVGRRVTFDFGTLTNSTGSDKTLIVTYRTVVLDSAGNKSGVHLDNHAEWLSDSSGSLGPAHTTLIVAEPKLSISKTADTSVIAVGSEVTITLKIKHSAASETNAYDASLTDHLPAELQYVPGSLECASGAQAANVCSESGGTITAKWNAFELGNGNGQATFRVRVLSLPRGGITNTASVAWTSLPGDVSSLQNSNVFSTERSYDPGSQINIYSTSHSIVLGSSKPGGGSRNGGGDHRGSAPASALLPVTGFAPNRVTDLRTIPEEDYAGTGGVTVEIPSLGISIPIVGVPLKNGTWNVSWLGKQAGWLEGSAFPSWNGNSVLTGHVYLSDGLPGPFANLNKLKYGDKIIIHAYGQKYTFEVRGNTVVEPNDSSILKHEEKPWLTLLTCKEYDERTNTYRKRVAIRAVLVSVAWE